MTPQEAIEYNKNLKVYMKITDKKSEYKFLPENYEALDMAIRALEVVQGMEEVFLQELPGLDMREATEEERNSLKRYIDSISQSTGVKFDFNRVKTELEPCEDCISREQAVYVASGYCAPQNIADELRKLPSVTPQPKMGRWIDIMVGDMPAQACDQCKTFYPLSYTGGGHNYCPNCGAKMEVEE